MRGTRGHLTLLLTITALMASMGFTPVTGADEHVPPQEMIVARDIDYDLGSPPTFPSGPEHNQLDIYAPAHGAQRPVVVWVHGGAWMRGDKANQMTHKPDLFVGAGYVFVSVNYRLSPDPPAPVVPGRVMFPDHPHDVGEAIAWIHRNIEEYGGDPDRLLLVGHSAGAHLIDLVATDHSYLEAYDVPSEVIRAVVSLDIGAFDIEEAMTDNPGPIGAVTLPNAFGNPAEEQLQPRWQAASPAHHAARARAPFLLVVMASNETRVDRTRRFAEALPTETELLLVDKTHAEINGHLGDPADDSPLTETVVRFLDDHDDRSPQ